MSPVRIAVVVPDVTCGGGVLSVARFLVRAIDRAADFECELISLATSASDRASLRLTVPTSWVGGPIVEPEVWEGRAYVHVGTHFTELEFQRYWPRRILSEVLEDFDIVQVVAGSPAWCLVARGFLGPVVLQVATLASVERRERLRHERGAVAWWRRAMARVTKRLDRVGARVADRILVENAWMERTLAAWTEPGTVILAPPGVDTVQFQPTRADEGHEARRPYILSVGRFADPRKNIGTLLNAYALVRGRRPSCPPLVLAGESMPSSREQERMRVLGIKDSVCMLGRVSRERLAELYRNAVLFALSSAEEGLGLVLLEAMSSGVPVVATCTEGAQQVIEDGRSGVLVPVGDAVRLADGVERLLTSPHLRESLARGARHRVVTRFSEEVAAKRFLDVYKTLFASSRETSSGSPGMPRR